MKPIFKVIFVVGLTLFVQTALFAQGKATSTKKTIKECLRSSLNQAFQKTKTKSYENLPLEGIGEGQGMGRGRATGAGIGNGNGNSQTPVITTPPPSTLVKVEPNADVYLISMPRAVYNDQAREKQVMGEVLLRITFLSSGQIGKISVVKGLPEGLTEQAKAAAQNIKFEPARRNCKDITKSKIVSYNFTLY